jgi:hypothetical protein
MASGPGLVRLDKAALNLGVLREHGLRRLGEALDAAGGSGSTGASSSDSSSSSSDGGGGGGGSSGGGKKALVLDPKVSGPLGLVAELPFLRQHGVGPMYHLQSGRLDTSAKTVVYLVRPMLRISCFA